MSKAIHHSPFHLLGRLSPRSRAWRPLLELALLVFIFLVGFIALTEGLHAAIGSRADDVLGHAAMAAALPAAFGAVALGGRRDPRTLLASERSGQLTLMAAAFAVTFVVAGLGRLGAAWVTGTVQPHRSSFSVPILLLTLTLIAIAAFAEEVVFRAWLPQALGVWTTSPWLAYGLTIPLFVLIHGTDDGWIGVVNHASMGICLAVLAWRFNSVAASTAVHAASNMVLVLAPELLTIGPNMDHAIAVVTAKVIASALVTALLCLWAPRSAQDQDTEAQGVDRHEGLIEVH